MKRLILGLGALWIFVPLAAILLSPAPSNAAAIVDDNLYPATISLVINSSDPIENGTSWFSQSNTPQGLLIFETYPFTIPASTDTNVDVTLNGPPPFGVYKSFSSQHQSFLGTYSGIAEPQGVIVLLKDGVGIGQSFESVFPGYNEADVFAALVKQGMGDTSGQGMLFSMMSNSLDVQPEWVASGIDEYTLGAANLVEFSDGSAVGTVVSSSFRITGGPLNVAVPEPGSMTMLCGLGFSMFVAVAWRKRQTAA